MEEKQQISIVADQVETVQKFGRSAYVIVLPAAWVRAQKISKGDKLKVCLLSDGAVLIKKIQASDSALAPTYTAATERQRGDVVND